MHGKTLFIVSVFVLLFILPFLIIENHDKTVAKQNLSDNALANTRSAASSTQVSVTICPHGLGNCGDSVNSNGGGNINPKHTQRTVTVSAFDANNQLASSGQGTVIYSSSTNTFSGTINLTNITSGNYTMTVKMDNFLSARSVGFQTVTTGTPISLPQVSVITGDIDNDDQLDILDYNILISCFGSKLALSSCSAPITTQSPGADINDDGKVDGIDYNLLIREFSVLKSGIPSPSTPPSPNPTGTGGLSSLHVQGNRLVNASGQTVQLRGVNRSGTEYMCVQGTNIFDGPSDAASIQAIKSWHAHVIRVPLNEDCWLGINGVGVGGAQYQQAIISYVNLINQNGLYVVLDLHWNAAGTTKATGQQDMADADHAPAFWTSVANAFKGNNTVIFDLYNEPHSIPWSCWKNGGSCGAPFPIAGMQQLVDAVRSTGSTNVLMLGGLQWSNDLTGWLANKPVDPQNNLAASWHVYNFNSCNNTGCFNSQMSPVAQQVPVIAGEMGENDCAHGFIDTVMGWLDTQSQSYLGWSWNTSSCGGFPSLITDYTGTPSNFGVGLKNHLVTFP